ncbi:4-hydroxy-2-oxo-heptane-1,7-dioate aldolase [Diaphorobacter nitroreducens]|uniref:HpcH/HpaI aldolase family protein n=1 Tax=Diaphorobacter nitroreducens TaxID=164759 RepID=UPI000B59DC30|nr:HpcH/HpaI aldolase/citrate lyase family protein [Diaphorobacter nitroreducens]ASI69288.1 4-hydroxy-2-oxo-heptane-1,7-dioate aldolase [Diaphorobacter nitroreducens]
MPVRNPFKHALAAGQAQIGIWSTLPSPLVTELIAGSGFDWVLLDTEHTPSDVPLMVQQLQAVAAGCRDHTHGVVRPAWNDPVLIKRYLDIGAQTLLLPFVQNADEARAAVAAMRYAPRGIRGMGGSMRASDFGRDAAYVRDAENELCLLVQVETAEALEQIEAIAAVEGVDGIFIGPADLSASMGFPGDANHPTVRAAIDDAIRRIRAAGKAPGTLVVDEARARECLALGAQFVAVGMDMLLLRQAADGLAARFRPGARGPVTTSY